MADLIFPDRRLDTVELLYPDQQPVGKVKINYEHPMARDLVFCSVGQNVVHGIDFSSVTLPVRETPLGSGFDMDGTGRARILIAEAPELKQTTDGFTWGCLFWKYGASVSYGRVFGRTYQEDGVSPYINWTIDLNRNNNGQDRCTVSYAPPSGNQIQLDVDNIITGRNTAVGVIESSSLVNGYSQGIFRASNTPTATEFTAGSNVYFGAWGDTALSNPASVNLMSVVWRRALDAQENREWNRNPYQMLVPV